MLKLENQNRKINDLKIEVNMTHVMSPGLNDVTWGHVTTKLLINMNWAKPKFMTLHNYKCKVHVEF